MKRGYLLVVLAIGCSSGGKPPASKEEVVAAAPVAPTPPKATPEEQAAALRRAAEAIAATTAAAQEAQLDAEQKARMEAIAAARNAGTLGSAALVQGGTFASLTGTGDISSGFDDVDVPQVRIGTPTCTGALDKAIIRRYIKRNIQRFTYCYEKQLLASPTLEGTVRTSFAISPSGAVPSATAAGVAPEVSTCIARVLEAIEFPKPTGGALVQCTYPFTFSPR